MPSRDFNAQQTRPSRAVAAPGAVQAFNAARAVEQRPAAFLRDAGVAAALGVDPDVLLADADLLAALDSAGPAGLFALLNPRGSRLDASLQKAGDIDDITPAMLMAARLTRVDQTPAAPGLGQLMAGGIDAAVRGALRGDGCTEHEIEALKPALADSEAEAARHGQPAVRRLGPGEWLKVMNWLHGAPGKATRGFADAQTPRHDRASFIRSKLLKYTALPLR